MATQRFFICTLTWGNLTKSCKIFFKWVETQPPTRNVWPDMDLNLSLIFSGWQYDRTLNLNSRLKSHHLGLENAHRGTKMKIITIPRCSFCIGIFIYIWRNFMVNVGKHTYTKRASGILWCRLTSFELKLGSCEFLGPNLRQQVEQLSWTDLQPQLAKTQPKTHLWNCSLFVCLLVGCLFVCWLVVCLFVCSFVRFLTLFS